MSKRLAHFLLILSTAMVWCPLTHSQTIVPGTPAFCTNKTGELYCLLPILFAEANPNPFTPITSAFATQLTQLPLASPASGIIYVYDPRSGVPKRTGQETYGPVSHWNGATLAGRDRLFVSFTYQRFTFSSIDGIGLNDINVVFNALLCDWTMRSNWNNG